MGKVPDHDPETDSALARLTAILPREAPRLWVTLRPPVSESDLLVLRDALAPVAVPSSVVTLLRWADGQDEAGAVEDWPSLGCCPLLSALQIVEHYQRLLDGAEDWQWTPMWLPVTHSSWNQAALDLTTRRVGVVPDASWPNLPRVIAPSLPSALEATADIAESGLLRETSPTIGAPFIEWNTQRRRVRSLRYDLVGWDHSPFPPDTDIDPELWPEDWLRQGPDGTPIRPKLPGR